MQTSSLLSTKMVLSTLKGVYMSMHIFCQQNRITALNMNMNKCLNYKLTKEKGGSASYIMGV